MNLLKLESSFGALRSTNKKLHLSVIIVAIETAPALLLCMRIAI